MRRGGEQLTHPLDAVSLAHNRRDGTAKFENKPSVSRAQLHTTHHAPVRRSKHSLMWRR
jgi:hypothetical protein